MNISEKVRLFYIRDQEDHYIPNNWWHCASNLNVPVTTGALDITS